MTVPACAATIDAAIDRRGVATSRALAIDALQTANSGHPENRWSSGVETTTGLLGEGAATSVGMAIAHRWMARSSTRPGYLRFDSDVDASCRDG